MVLLQDILECIKKVERHLLILLPVSLLGPELLNIELI